MSRIKVIERDLKSNFEVRITDKSNKTSKMVSLLAEGHTLESIRDLIKECLEDEGN